MSRIQSQKAVLRALHPGPLSSEQPLTGSGLVIGRDGQVVDLILHGPDVSRRHAWIGPDPDGNWSIQDLESTNGVFVNGEKIDHAHQLTTGDVIGLGRALAPDYVFSMDSTNPAEQTLVLNGDGPWLIGRELDHPISLPADPTVSKRHARLVHQGSHLVIEDLHSRNGVWINGQRKRRAAISNSDRIVIGHNQLRVDDSSEDRLVVVVRNLGTAIDLNASGLVLGPNSTPVDIKLAAGHLHILHLPDPIQRRALLLIVAAPPSSRKDKLEWSDAYLAEQPEQQRDRIALVPATPDLALDQNQSLVTWLDDEATLAIAGDLSDRRRHELVTTTLEALGLTNRATHRLGDLDRLERALARLASALLTRPGLLLLDEPAAGLDAKDTHRLYQHLESLAGTSLTIVVASAATGVTPQPSRQPVQPQRIHTRWPGRRPSLAASTVLTRRLLANWRKSPLAVVQALALPLILLGGFWLLTQATNVGPLVIPSLLVGVPLTTSWLTCRWLPPGRPYLERQGLLADQWIAAGLVMGLLIVIQCSLVWTAGNWITGWPIDPVISLATALGAGLTGLVVGMAATGMVSLRPMPALAISALGSMGLATVWMLDFF